MGLPPHDERGTLPALPHNNAHCCSLDDMEQRFVCDLGSPEWRSRLMDGFRTVAMLVKDDCPGAYWWVWGRFVSNLAEPQFGDREALTGLAFLPIVDLGALPDHRAAEVLNVLQRAEQENSVDAAYVFDFPDGHIGVADTLASLETKWRPRAIRSPIEGDDNPVGFIEVRL